MAFREIMEGLSLPEGASDRYRRLEALERMQLGTLYDDLEFSFETERINGRKYIPVRERRPSSDFCLAHEITQDTLAELFGDEQFPIVRAMTVDDPNEPATKALADLIAATGLDAILAEIYETGVVGGVGVVVHRSDDGGPYYEVLPAKYCEPIYRSKYSNELVALVVTYPIGREQAEEMCPGITDEPANRGVETFWYREIVGPQQTVIYRPLSDALFARLGEKDDKGDVIEFVEHAREAHGFDRTPAVYTKNLGGRQRDLDGPCLWWPIRNLCIAIDYGLSEIERGLRYSADPMLFLKKTGLAQYSDDDSPAGYEADAAARGAAAQHDDGGTQVRGVTQTIVGEDAKLLEISANGIKEKREFARDLREYALEIVGGMKARAEHLRAATSGKALDKGQKPLRRLVRRQRRPYGDDTLLALIDLTLHGFACKALDAKAVNANVAAIPADARTVLDWPNDETMQGADLLAHVTAIQLAAGGSALKPLQLIEPAIMGAKLARDMGEHEPYDEIKGDCEPLPEPVAASSIVKP